MLSLVKTEQQCINCVWDNPENIYRFDKSYFVSGVANDIFSGIKHLYENKVEITINNLVALKNDANQNITKENLKKLRSQEYDPGYFDFYFKNLKKLYAKDNIEEKLLKDTLIEVSSKGELDIEKLKRLTSEIEKNIELVEGKDSLLRTLDEVVENYRGVLIKRQRGEYVFPTGDSHLDTFLAEGYFPGQITTIFGSTGVGKSMYALNQISRQINKRIPCVYYTLEMSEISTMDRLISLRTKTPSSFFRLNSDGELPDVAFRILEEESNKLRKYSDRFFLVENPSISLSDFEITIKEAQKRMKTNYLVATIDLFTMLTDVGQDAREIEEAMNKLHSIVKRTGIHAVIIVQANRTADSNRIVSIEEISTLRPSINTIKNAHAIAERSRIIISAFRPKYYASRLFPESDELEFMDDILELQILKQSSGEVGRIVKYLYDPECFRVFPFLDEEEIN